MKKQRPPIEQLREAGKIAHEMLVSKGLIAQTSVIDELLKRKDAPTLPGIPAYLPRPDTIRTAQRIMRDIIIMWKEHTRGDIKKRDNMEQFFKFIIKSLKDHEKSYKTEMKQMPKFFDSLKQVPVLKEIFSPVRKLENIQAISRFFVDSFAVGMGVYDKHTTSQYVNWFLDWSNEMYDLWSNKSE